MLVYPYHGWYVFHTAAVTDDQIHSHGLHNYVTSTKILAAIRYKGFGCPNFTQM